MEIFLKKDRQMANTYMKRCLASLTISEMYQNHSDLYHFTPVRMAIFKNKR